MCLHMFSLASATLHHAAQSPLPPHRLCLCTHKPQTAERRAASASLPRLRLPDRSGDPQQTQQHERSQPAGAGLVGGDPDRPRRPSSDRGCCDQEWRA